MEHFRLGIDEIGPKTRRARKKPMPPSITPDLLGSGRLPDDVQQLLERLYQAGYGVWLVGGVVRDAMLGRSPHDWDVATDAPLDRIFSLFPRVVPVGLRHGTVQVLTPAHVVEVTVFSGEGAEGLKRDLDRRDFTVNAMALSYPDGDLRDPHGGAKDLAAMRLRAVGSARDRFIDDPLRVLRLPRLVGQYGLRVEKDTLRTAGQEAFRLREVAAERIRDEIMKFLLGDHVLEGFAVFKRSGAMREVLPELLEGERKKQNQFHRYDIYQHILRTVAASPRRERVRLAALLHDIAKPRARFKKDGVYRFHGHEELGAEMAGNILRRWRMPEKTVIQVQILIRNHMLIHTDRWSDASIRRLISRTGIDLLDDLLDLSRADRSTHAEAEPLLSEIDRLETRIQEQLDRNVPLAVSDLAINGRDVMTALEIGPGPAVGRILSEARAWVLQYPENNKKDLLSEWIKARRVGDQA